MIEWRLTDRTCLISKIQNVWSDQETTFRTKIGRSPGYGSIQKNGTPYLFLQPLKLATSNLVHNLGWALAYQKRLGPKLAGVWANEASKKIWDPYVFLQPLKLATSNLVYNLGLVSSLPRNNFYDENWQGARLGEHPKNFGTPYLFLQPLKLATSIWYTTWAWRVAYQEETTFRTKIMAGVRAREAS